MVEFNAHGLHSFFSLLKNFSVGGLKFGKEWATWVMMKMMEKSKSFKEWVKKKYQEYFIK
jgi:hypothetical protein